MGLVLFMPLLLVFAPAAGALPTGGVIKAGQGGVGPPLDDTLTVTQASDKLIIDWDSFSITAGERVVFVQPGVDSVALNRVVGPDPSSIYGQLQANGQIFLVNPSGVVFGAGARVDVGALVVSTLDISDDDFWSGSLSFSGGGAGAVTVAGPSGDSPAAVLSAREGGHIVLVAPQVMAGGVVEADRVEIQGGRVVLSGAVQAAEAIDVHGASVELQGARLSGTGHAAFRSDGDVEVSGDVEHDLSGSLMLRADAQGSGTGTVRFAEGASIVVHRAEAGVQILYNPEPQGPGHKYNHATDYSAYVSGAVPTAYMLVNDVHDLQAMRENLDGTYALGRDIDASETRYWHEVGPGTYAGFEPVGSPGLPFAGRLDGFGHIVRGLYINRYGHDHVGLFGYLGELSTVRRLGLVDVHVQGGWDDDGRIGGLAGVNLGSIEYTHVSGRLEGTVHVGGLVGENYGYIERSYAEADVKGDMGVGGLAGSNMGTILQSYATGAVTAALYGAGGLAAWNEGFIAQSYATGSVTAAGEDGIAGGLVGTLYENGVIQESYATGRVQAPRLVGGLVGSTLFDPTVTDSYWDRETTGQDASEGGEGKNTGELMGGLPPGFDPDVWGIEPGGSYPYLRWRYPGGVQVVSGSVSTSFAPGTEVALAVNGQIRARMVAAANNTFYTVFEKGALTEADAALLLASGNGLLGNTVFVAGGGHRTDLLIVPGTVLVLAGSDAASSSTGLVQARGQLQDGALYTGDKSRILLAEGVGLTVLNPTFRLEGDIVAQGADIAFAGSVTVAGDATVATSGSGVLSMGSVTGDGQHVLRLSAGAGGMLLGGEIRLPAGRVVLESLAPVTLSHAVVARELALVGEQSEFVLTHPDNAVDVLAADARAVHYEQAGSLTIGPVSLPGAGQAARVVQGVKAAERVFVRAYDPGAVLTLNQPVEAHGDGYALVLQAGGSFRNEAGDQPLRVTQGLYLVYSDNPAANDLGAFRSPGNLFDSSFAAWPPERLVAEYGRSLGSRMVYAWRPELVVRPVTVEVVYGSSVPATFGYTVQGLVDGDRLSDVISGAYVTDATTGSPVGRYDIKEDPANPFVARFGYALRVEAGTLIITPRPLVVIADSFEKVYGEPDPAEWTYRVAPGGLVGDDRLTGALSRAAGEDAGTYAIGRGTLDNPNYEIYVVEGTLTIRPRPITVTADSAGKLFGELDPILTYTITSGNLVGDDQLQGQLTRDPGETAGVYLIRQGTLGHRNYAIQFVPGLFVISPGAAGVDAILDDVPDISPAGPFPAPAAGFPGDGPTGTALDGTGFPFLIETLPAPGDRLPPDAASSTGGPVAEGNGSDDGAGDAAREYGDAESDGERGEERANEREGQGGDQEGEDERKDETD